MKFIIKLSIERVAGAIVLGHSLKYIFESFLDNSKIYVIQNGIKDNYLAYKGIHSETKKQ